MDNLIYPGSLHNHTDYSNLRLRDCINKVPALIDRAIELNHKVVAITDHETVSSYIAVENYRDKILKEYPDFKIILGNEIYLCRDGLNAENYNKGIDRYFHFILLAKDEIGNKQIRELSTRAWMRSYKQFQTRVPTYYQDLYDIIEPNPGHVIASTACLGGNLDTQLIRYRESNDNNLYNHILDWLIKMNSLFGKGNFYLEMQPSYDKDQIYVNKEILKISNKLNIPYIITNDAHYLKKEDINIHSAYLKSQDGERETKEFYATTYLMEDNEIREYMSDYMTEEHFNKAYNNIIQIANMCSNYSIKKPLKIPNLNWKTPKYTFNEQLSKLIPNLQKFYNSSYAADKRLAELISDRISTDKTLQNIETYEEVDACLNDTWVSSEVNGSRWSAYMLNLQNIVDSCWESNSLVGPGRGSGVGFILLYILDITQINPLREKTKCFRWRFLNPERVSPLDVDIDIEGNKREAVLKTFRKKYGEDRVAGVLTLGTEKSKSAIQTAARGLGIDTDIAQYLSSMIVADRGQLRSLKQTFYGDPDNDIAPNKQFQREMTENYPELWEVSQYIEGLICRSGVHAGGVVFVDEPFTETGALMKSPKGEIITQFELHAAEEVGNIKYDILSIEALDKIHNDLDLLLRYNYIEDKGSLKATYENAIDIYKLERNNPDMWKMCWEHKVMSLFQMEKPSGIAGISILKPASVDELAILNSTIRLMAQEKGGEMPTEKLARFKKNPQAWIEEMNNYGIKPEHQELLKSVVGISYGLCIAQEQFMQLVQLPELGGFNLTWADKLRKSIAKKNPAAYEELTKEFFKVTEEKGCDKNLCSYVWNVLIAMSRGYGFNQSHTLAYSLVGLQELNLAFKYPTICWNCACLISDSGGQLSEENEDEDLEVNEYSCVNETDEENIDENDKNAEEKKKKNSSVDYGKIATAIGQMQSQNIKVTPPNINKSGYTFLPEIQSNTIIYGIKGIARIGDDLVETIIKNRPYNSISDFLHKVKVNKTQMVNLIKSGAFDNFGDRQKVMEDYIHSICGEKQRLTLQNMPGLIKYDCFHTEELKLPIKIFNFNKYLKKNKVKDFYNLDNIAFNFYEKHFDLDILYFQPDNQILILQKDWDKIYKKEMDIVRDYLKENKETLLTELNYKIYKEMYDKYAKGNISKWEMDSISFYYHEHELSKLRQDVYEITDFNKLSEEPQIDRMINIKGRDIPLYKLSRIAGTILDKDKTKNTITLLTTTGVVKVKIYKPQFTKYDKQLSEKLPDGTKHVIEKSWFTRGNKIMIIGIRRGQDFVPKIYKSSGHKTPFFLIEDIDDEGYVVGTEERMEV